jgi:hypothetical protein
LQPALALLLPKERVTHELQQQLEHQIRFAQEAEACIKLLEAELTNTHAKIAAHEQALAQTCTLN